MKQINDLPSLMATIFTPSFELVDRKQGASIASAARTSIYEVTNEVFLRVHSADIDFGRKDDEILAKIFKGARLELAKNTDFWWCIAIGGEEEVEDIEEEIDRLLTLPDDAEIRALAQRAGTAAGVKICERSERRILQKNKDHFEKGDLFRWGGEE